MMQLIMPEYYGEFVNDRAEMHRLRYRAFKQRLDWTVEVSGDMEVDEFDVLRPVHLLNRSGAGQIQGCVRLLPSTGTLFRSCWTGSRHHEATGSGEQPIRARCSRGCAGERWSCCCHLRAVCGHD